MVSERALWPSQTWKYHWSLSAIKSDNLKNSVIRSYRKLLELGFKLKIQLLQRFVHPTYDIKFADTREKFKKSVYQTNDTKELKTQGAECQGPDLILQSVYARTNARTNTARMHWRHWQCEIKAYYNGILDTSLPVNFASLQFCPLCKMLVVVDAWLHALQFPVNAT